jgi:dephospho-CoA kinase
MLWSIVVLLPGVTLGLLTKKVLRWFFPSKAALVNASRRIGHKILVPLIVCIDVMYGLTLLKNRLSPSFAGLGVVSFIVGYQISVLGLTGGIATGKSTASAYIKTSYGAEIIDADAIAREIVRPGESGYNAIVRAFGADIVEKASGEIDRKRLGEIIFGDKLQKAKLERITHPRVIARMICKVIFHRLLGRLVVVDVPLLFERRKVPLLYLLCSETIYIDLDEAEQLRRLQRRNPDLNTKEAQKRIEAQISRREKLEMADYVISNSGSIEDLHRNLDQFFSK